MDNPRGPRVRFGEFELDLRAGELRRGKARLRLQEQPFQILSMLLERPGEVVTREEVQRRLWPNDTIVEFDHSIGTAIKKLRQALGDEAASPRYVETLPRRGFRFIYPDVVASPALETLSAPPSAEPHRSLGRLGLFTAAVCLAVGWWATVLWRQFAPSRAHDRLDDSSLTQLTTSAGLDTQPSLSPDGSSMAYSSDQSGRFEIYVKSLEPGGREMQLTSDGGGNFEPAWSPDGKQIAYYSAKYDGIWVMPALGGTAHLLTKFGSWPAWSPDGTRIAFQSQGQNDVSQTSFAAMPPSTLWIVPAQGGAPTQLTKAGNPSGGHGAPSWSPDGKRIVFSATSTSFGEVWSVPATGGQPIRLVRRFGYDPVYGPDGREIYYSQGWVSFWALMKIELKPDGSAAGEPVLVKNTGRVLYKHLHFSADGRFMVFTALGAQDELGMVRLNPATAAPAGEPELLTRDTNMRKTFPLFSPDGNRIAFAVVQIGSGVNVWVMDADGKNPHLLEVGGSQNRTYPVGWLADSQRAVIGSQSVTGAGTSGYVLESVDINSGEIQHLRALGPNDAQIRISPDGKQIAFSRRHDGALNVWTAAVNGGETRQLTFDKESISFPSWSPDGRFLAVELQAGAQIGVIASNGGPVVQLTHDPGPHWPNGWSPDGDKVVYAGRRDGAWNIWWVSRRTKEEKQLTHYTGTNSYVRYPAWSPRGDRIVYEYAQTTGNIWLMKTK